MALGFGAAALRRKNALGRIERRAERLKNFQKARRKARLPVDRDGDGRVLDGTAHEHAIASRRFREAEAKSAASRVAGLRAAGTGAPPEMVEAHAEAKRGLAALRVAVRAAKGTETEAAAAAQVSEGVKAVRRIADRIRRAERKALDQTLAQRPALDAERDAAEQALGGAARAVRHQAERRKLAALGDAGAHHAAVNAQAAVRVAEINRNLATTSYAQQGSRVASLDPLVRAQEKPKRKPRKGGAVKKADWSGEFRIAKAAPTGKYVAGWFSVIEVDGQPVTDTQGDVIDMDELRKSAHAFVSDARQAKVMHDGEPIGRVVESVLVDDDFAKVHGIGHGKRGWWGAMEITDPATQRRAAQGELKAFSIGGRGKRVPIEKRSARPRRYAIGLVGLARQRAALAARDPAVRRQTASAARRVRAMAAATLIGMSGSTLGLTAHYHSPAAREIRQIGSQHSADMAQQREREDQTYSRLRRNHKDVVGRMRRFSKRRRKA